MIWATSEVASKPLRQVRRELGGRRARRAGDEHAEERDGVSGVGGASAGAGAAAAGGGVGGVGGAVGGAAGGARAATRPAAPPPGATAAAA